MEGGPGGAPGGGGRGGWAWDGARTTTGGSVLASGASAVTAGGGAEVSDQRTREAGVIAGRWWDERYDAIVTAWTESREP